MAAWVGIIFIQKKYVYREMLREKTGFWVVTKIFYLLDSAASSSCLVSLEALIASSFSCLSSEVR